MHICQCCFSLESASWKCLWRIQPRMNIAVNRSHRNSSERLPLYCQSLSLAARNHMEILFLIRGHVWKASAKLCKIMKTYFMRIKLVPVSLRVLFLRIKEQAGLLLHRSLIIVLDKMTRTADDSFPARVGFSLGRRLCSPSLTFRFHSNKSTVYKKNFNMYLTSHMYLPCFSPWSRVLASNLKI